MKRLTVNTNRLALVYKKGELVKILPAGNYWLGFGEDYELADINEPVLKTWPLDVLLQNEDFRNRTDVIDIADNQLVLVYKDNIFQKTLTAGRYAYWKGNANYRFIYADMSNLNIGADIDPNLLDKQPLAAFVRNYKVEPHEQALLFVDGRMEQVLAPGNYYWWKNSISIQCLKADMRTLPLEITGQEILTKDKAQLRINFSCQYRVADIVTALKENKDYERQLYTGIQLALRELVRRMNFDELMESKELIPEQIMNNLVATATRLGVQLTGCGVKDIILPGDIREIMNQVLIAEKKAQANLVTRREETASTRSLLNTAKMMEDNNMLYRLKEMEYVEKIAEKINTISISGGGQILDQLKQIFVK